jgi:DNA-binding response OmpR family regulator
MSNKGNILSVNQNHQNLLILREVLAKADYEIIPISDLKALDDALAYPDHIDLALVDITGFDGQIWQRCERMREANIPLLLIAARQSPAVTEAGEHHGANNVLIKPLAIRELISLINLLVQS